MIRLPGLARRWWLARLPWLGLLVLLCSVPGLAWHASAAPVDLPMAGTNRQSPLIVLDPGHNPKQPGALGARGVYEVEYNDTFCRELADILRNAGFRVLLTRQPDQNISLDERPAFAEHEHAAMFLAIHHDSAQLVYLEKSEFQGKPAYTTRQPLSGYAIFISTTNPLHERSRVLAQLLGESLHELGRAPSQHHAEKIAGENRELLDATLGIYRFDELIVLKKATVPAALLEIGVIVDPDDEHYVSDIDNRHKMQEAIARALTRYFAPSH